MSIQAVNKYLSSNVTAPFFLVVGDRQYMDFKNKLLELGLSFVRISDYCGDDDKLPNIDSLIGHLKAIHKNEDDKRVVVIGLGEYLALRGNSEAVSTFSRLKDLNIGKAKVIVLLRGSVAQINDFRADPRFDNRRFCIIDKVECDLSITLALPSVGLSAFSGIKSLLRALEDGEHGDILVNTSVNLDNSLFTVRRITNAFEGIKHSFPDFGLPRSCGSDDCWAKLLFELTQCGSSLDSVFAKHGLDRSLESDLCDRVGKGNYESWLHFIALKSKLDTLSNSYLRFVLDRTDRFEEFKTNVLNAIIEVQHTDTRFALYYKERKKLVKEFPESDIADFVVRNRKTTAESIYKLTDNTKTEREEIIAWVSKYGTVAEIADIYPGLADYLKVYVFNCGELSDLLTDYFDAYKHQKVSNTLEADFVEKVEKLARSREYNRLPTRNEIIDVFSTHDTYLYWLDALGVEYLAFISELARKRGLSISIYIARANLPTITSVNRDFFESWHGKKEKDKELDDTKHNDEGGYNFVNNELPIHLAKELDTITKVFDKAATELNKRYFKRFLIASDHGASRLAVLQRKEEKYEADAKGEYSGRCCESFGSYNLPFATKENGYLVLADYGRFKGSRAACVEVHGGASLEEVVVPIIELTLKDSNITVELVEEFTTVDLRAGTEIELFSNSPLKDLSVVLNHKRYHASPVDSHHYKVVLSDIKRAGNYLADVYSGDDLIGQISVKAQGKSGKVNEEFDDLF